MNLFQPFRAEIEKVGASVSDTFDFVCAKINALWNEQHDSDGAHTNITADTITLASDPNDGAWAGSVGGSLVPITSTQDLGALVSRPANAAGPVFAAFSWRNLYLSGFIAFKPFADPDVSPGQTIDGSFWVNNVGDIQLFAVSGIFNAALTLNGVTGVTVNNAITAASGYFERSRTTALGEWITPTYNAGDFTGSGTITWTVDAADVQTMAYTLIGKMMTISFVLQSTTVAGAGAVLQVLIPGGFTAAKAMRNAAEAVDNGVRTTARIGVTASGTLLLIQRTDAVNWTASVNNTAVSAQLSFQVV